MSEQATTPDINGLFESLEIVEKQRAVLGDTVDPLIEDIKIKILDSVHEPTDKQIAKHDSWRTIVNTSEQLGLPIPNVPDEIAEDIEAVTSYRQLLQRVGRTSLSTEVEPTPPEQIVHPTENTQTPPATSRRRRPRASAPETSPAATSETTHKPHQKVEIPETYDGKIIISDGDSEFSPRDSTKQMYLKVFKALVESENGSIDITQFLRKVATVSSTELARKIQNKEELEGPVSVAEAKKIIQQFYGTLDRLKSRHLVEHTPGTMAKKGSNDVFSSGTVRLFSPLNTTEDGGVLKVEAASKPYNVGINLHEQTIDNGRGTKHEITTRPEKFTRIAQAIGSISARSQLEQSRFSNNDIRDWIMDEYGVNIVSRQELHSFRADLKKVLGKFGDNFPLKTIGSPRSNTYSWDTRTTLNIIKDNPEKPHFEKPVYISINGNIVTANINGTEHTLFDYGKDKKFVIKNADVKDLLARNKGLFEVLSQLGAEDEVQLSKLLNELKLGTDKKERINLSNWIRKLLEKLNTFTDDDIANYNRRGTISIDLNRRIILVDGNEQEQDPGNISSTPPPTPSPSITTSEHDQPGVLEIDPNGPVGPRLTPVQLAKQIHDLDNSKKLNIQGIMLTYGTVKFPKSLVEAGYLLQLLTDDKIMANVREGSDKFRFDRDGSEFRNWRSNALLACYLRTLSWGDFTELGNAMAEINGVEISQSSLNQIRNISEGMKRKAELKSTKGTSVITENANNQRYLDKALPALMRGNIKYPNNPIKAINLLRLFQQNREAISSGKTNARFDAIVEELHSVVMRELGKGRTLVDIASSISAQALTSQR